MQYALSFPEKKVQLSVYTEANQEAVHLYSFEKILFLKILRCPLKFDSMELSL